MKSVTKQITVDLLPAPPSHLLPSAPASGSAYTRTDRIVAYHNATRLADATRKIAAFFTGVELLSAKDEVGHGKFLAWFEANLGPQFTYRTAARYMKFAEPHLPRWLEMVNGQGKSSHALQLTNGLVTEDTFQSACEFLKNTDDGQLFTELSRDFGLSRLPSHQKDRDNARKTTPEETAAERQQAALAFADLLIANDATFCADNKSTHQLHSDLDTAKIKELLDAGLTRNRLCKEILKARKKVGRVAPRAPLAKMKGARK